MDEKKYVDLNALQIIFNNLKSMFATKTEVDNATAKIPTTNIIHGDDENILSSIIETYILNINYEALSFDTLELVISGNGSFDDKISPVIGTGMLGYMILA